jgi:hypothetical protein
MTIFDNLCTKRTGYKVAARTGVSAALAVSETGASEPMGFGTNDEYEMTLTVSCTFWAGSVMKEEAFATAKEALLHNLYADILPKLSEAQAAICSDDGHTAMELLHEVKRTIGGAQ